MGWEHPDPGELLLLRSDADWAALKDKYPSEPATQKLPLERCLDVLRSCGAQCVLVETRYIDIDFRGEYSAFFSRTFESIPDNTHRLHFFKTSLTLDQVFGLPQDAGYLGYVVVRPTPASRVGRALIPPPPDVRPFVRSLVRDRVNFFGQELVAEGVPFMQQDSQLGRCAHVAAWVCYHTAYLRGEVGRRAISEFALMTETGLGFSRPIPSAGLSAHQMLELMRLFELPALFYNVQGLPRYPAAPWSSPDPIAPPTPDPSRQHPGFWDTRIFRICCWFLNSEFPVIVINRNHAFVLIGYRREVRGPGNRDWITFFRQDDQRGPYLPVVDVFNDVHSLSSYTYSPWEALMVPLPRKLWLPPDPVEFRGGRLLLGAIPTAIKASVPSADELNVLRAAGRLTLRTYAISSNRLKVDAVVRLHPDLSLQCRTARLPRYVWIVEAVDRDLRNQQKPCVLGEVIFDATSSEFAPTCLAWHVPGYAWIRHSDGTSHEVKC